MPYKDAKQRIREAYDKQIITPLAGKGNLARQLLDGLDSILDKVEQDLEGTITISYNEDTEPFLKKPVDYDALETIAAQRPNWPNTLPRLKDRLASLKIDSNKKLVEHLKFHGGYNHGVRVPCLRGIGRQACILLYTYLDQNGVQVFSSPYTHQEIIEEA